MGRGRIATGAPLAAGLAFAAPADAALFEVDSKADSTLTACNSGPGDCSLRGALQNAAATPGPHEIVFAASVTGTITLGSALPDIVEPVEIRGPGVDALRLDADGNDRILSIAPDPGDDVIISDLTLTGGRAEGGGGAIHKSGGDVRIARSVLSGNHSYQSGAIHQSREGSLTIVQSELSGNTAERFGLAGAIASFAPLTVVSSTLSDNRLDRWDPRGIPAASGGAISQWGPSTRITNSTITGNRVLSVRDHGGGGAVFFESGAHVVENSTITGNSVALEAFGLAYGGGIATYRYDTTPPPVLLENTIVAGNSVTKENPNAHTLGPDLHGNFELSFSLVGDDADATITDGVPGSNLLNTDPMLGALAHRGGPTPTIPPRPGSPVIDRGSSFGSARDQRGSRRPSNDPAIPDSVAAGADGSDIGAFEVLIPDVTCAGRRPTAIGTRGADVIHGTNGDDVIASLAGNDRVFTGPGDDLVCSGPGHDRVFTRAGFDRVFAGAGADRVFGGSAGDRLHGQRGFDQLFGGAGGDRLFGGAGRDLLLGLRGRPDRCFGGAGRDRGGAGCERRRSLP